MAPWLKVLKSALPVLAVAGALTCARAEDAPAPVDLHPAKPAKAAPHPPQKPAAPITDAAASISSADAIRRANAYLDGAQVMTADFVQMAPDGKRSEGKLYVQRPGHMRFQYAPPDRLEIIADGRSVAVRDQKLGTQDLYFIGQTPLKFLLSDHIDISRDTQIEGVSSDPNAVAITILDKATFGGSARITLVFDPSTFALKQWTVLDGQGLQTVVTLFNVDLSATPDPALFKIDEQQRLLNSNVR
jgi:outer membrane lipoprotein-sorting protein